MDPTFSLMLDELRFVPVNDLQEMLDENLNEYTRLRMLGLGPGDEEFDQNTLFFVVYTTALEHRTVAA